MNFFYTFCYSEKFIYLLTNRMLSWTRAAAGVKLSVVDPERFDADPDPTFQADPDPKFC